MCYIITKIICICEWKALHGWNQLRNTENRNHFRNEHTVKEEKKLCETIRWGKKCHLQLSVWINENLLEYKASSSENSELENWKENGYEIGKWSILCLFSFFLSFFHRVVILHENPFVSLCFGWMTNNAQPKDNFCRNKKKITSNDFG